MSTMRRVTNLYSRSRWKTATFYVDSRDAVDDGSSNVASVTDRVGSRVFASDASGNRPTIDTSLLGGTKLIHYNTGNIARNLQYSGANGFGGEDTPVSFVVRIRPSVNAGRIVVSTHVANTPPTAAVGFSKVGFFFSNLTWFRGTTSGGGAPYNSNNTTIDVNVWYTVGYSFTGSTVRFYRNGVATGTSASNLASLGAHTMIMLGNSDTLGQCQYGYYAGWKGWAGVAISDAQHLYEHNQFAAWAA